MHPSRLFPFAAILLAGSASADVVPWQPARISSPLFESHATFDPRTRDLYFVRSSKDFSGWRILVSHCGADGWSEPAPPPFAGDGVEADPWFTPDGSSLYFISTRSTDGMVQPKNLDIWRMDRDAAGHWGTPRRLPEPVNSAGAEWFPRLAKDGWLYFGSSRPGGRGKNDIWRARQDASGNWRVEDLGPAINTAADEYEPLPAPDGKRMVIMAADGLYESLSDGKGGWNPKHKLGPDVDVNGSEIGAAFSPSGRSMLFARDLKGELSGEFFLQRAAPPEDWPPACPVGSR
jgi:hypothetical protein